MKIEEMRAKATNCGEAIAMFMEHRSQSERGADTVAMAEVAGIMAEDLKRTIWRSTAEICERLERIADAMEKA